MMDSLLGVSKATFLRTHVVPANDNDVFNDGKCAFCWGEYDEDHHAARILPCNHVFGSDCVKQFANAPRGNRCPICRTQLFRPSLRNFLIGYSAFLVSLLINIVVQWCAKVSSFCGTLPRWLKITWKIITLLFSRQMAPYLVTQVAESKTDLRARIANLSITYYIYLLAIQHELSRFLCGLLFDLYYQKIDVQIFRIFAGRLTGYKPSLDMEVSAPTFPPQLFVLAFMASATIYVWRSAVEGGRNTPHGLQAPVENWSDKAVLAVILSTGAIMLCISELWSISAFYFTCLQPWHPWVSVVLERSAFRGIYFRSVNFLAVTSQE